MQFRFDGVVAVVFFLNKEWREAQSSLSFFRCGCSWGFGRSLHCTVYYGGWVGVCVLCSLFSITKEKSNSSTRERKAKQSKQANPATSTRRCVVIIWRRRRSRRRRRRPFADAVAVNKPREDGDDEGREEKKKRYLFPFRVVLYCIVMLLLREDREVVWRRYVLVLTT